MKIAIFGANSAISFDYLSRLDASDKKTYFLFSRKSINIKKFKIPRHQIKLLEYDQFDVSNEYDIIINFIGCGDPQKLASMQNQIFQINDYYDNLILNYLAINPQTKYIYISSGASYLSKFEHPVKQDFIQSINITSELSHDNYSLAKFISELKHRSLSDLNIVDLRVFSYFRNVNPEYERSLIGTLMSCIKSQATFETTNHDLWRDYINDEIFARALNAVVEAENMNCAFDVFSLMPISKLKILKVLAERYSLNYRFINNETGIQHTSTGTKPYYYSLNKSISKIGFEPSKTSEEVILAGVEKMLRIDQEYPTC